MTFAMPELLCLVKAGFSKADIVAALERSVANPDAAPPAPAEPEAKTNDNATGELAALRAQVADLQAQLTTRTTAPAPQPVDPFAALAAAWEV